MIYGAQDNKMVYSLSHSDSLSHADSLSHSHADSLIHSHVDSLTLAHTLMIDYLSALSVLSLSIAYSHAYHALQRTFCGG